MEQREEKSSRARDKKKKCEGGFIESRGGVSACAYACVDVGVHVGE